VRAGKRDHGTQTVCSVRVLPLQSTIEINPPVKKASPERERERERERESDSPPRRQSLKYGSVPPPANRRERQSGISVEGISEGRSSRSAGSRWPDNISDRTD
jgi:hypothetical protein